MTRLLIVGDVHGCHSELLELLDRAALASDDLLLSVGDLVDRGPESVEVLDFFRTRPRSLALMGNHERKHVRGVFSYSQEITRLQFGGAYQQACAWMRALPYYFENEHVRVVHAAMVPGLPLAEQREDVLCGSAAGERTLGELFPEGYWHEHYEDAKPIVFGHHVTGAEPLVRDDLVFGIDTGACHGLRLTALSVPDFRLYSVPARADHWQQTQRRFQLAVLRSKPWTTTPFARFGEKLADFVRSDDPEVRAYAESLLAWSRDLQGHHTALFQALLREAEHLRASAGDENFARAAQAHPAAGLLFQARAGRLEPRLVAGYCSTPEKTLALAASLGVSVECREAPC